jgi:hypothetical protein
MIPTSCGVSAGRSRCWPSAANSYTVKISGCGGSGALFARAAVVITSLPSLQNNGDAAAVAALNWSVFSVSEARLFSPSFVLMDLPNFLKDGRNANSTGPEVLPQRTKTPSVATNSAPKPPRIHRTTLPLPRSTRKLGVSADRQARVGGRSAGVVQASWVGIRLPAQLSECRAVLDGVSTLEALWDRGRRSW